jgi:hypothetical protein
LRAISSSADYRRRLLSSLEALRRVLADRRRKNLSIFRALALPQTFRPFLDEERFMRYSHAALNPVSVGGQKLSRSNEAHVRRASAPRRLAWKIVYSSFVAGVALYVWWRR